MRKWVVRQGRIFFKVDSPELMSAAELQAGCLFPITAEHVVYNFSELPSVLAGGSAVGQFPDLVRGICVYMCVRPCVCVCVFQLSETGSFAQCRGGDRPAMTGSLPSFRPRAGCTRLVSFVAHSRKKYPPPFL